MAVRRVGPYRVERELGAGGMGVVYEVTDESGARLAVKTLRAELRDRSIMERFLREGSIRVAHPNVIQVLEAGSYDGVPYIAMKLLAGRTLADRMASGPMPMSELCDVMAQVCDGVAAAHAMGIVHRDLKPANVFCCEDATVKVVDFGIARVAEASRLRQQPRHRGRPRQGHTSGDDR
jgi:serine/threonine-protein kinase